MTWHDVVDGLRSQDGISLQSAVGTWTLSTDPTDPSFVWTLTELDPEAEEAIGQSANDFSATVRTVFTDDGVLYELFFNGRQVSTSQYNVKFVDDKLEDNVTRYFELMDKLLVLAGNTLLKFSKGLTKLPPIKAKVDLAQALKTNDVNAIVTAAKANEKLTADDIISIYLKAKELKSNKLMNLTREIAGQQEALLGTTWVLAMLLS